MTLMARGRKKNNMLQKNQQKLQIKNEYGKEWTNKFEENDNYFNMDRKKKLQVFTSMKMKNKRKA